MVFENLEVIHKSFGKGVVIEASGKYITVRFDNCQKNFVYPDAFEKFLTLADGTISAEISRDLAFANDEKQRIINEKNEENIRSMTHGIVIPGKENTQLDSEDEESGFKNTESEEF